MVDIYKSIADEPEIDEDDALRDAAREVIAVPPEQIPDAAGLPDDVPDGVIDDGDGGS